MKVKFTIVRHMAKAPITIPFRIINTQASGKKISLMVKGSKNLEMVHTMREIFKKESNKAMGTMFVSQEFMKDSFQRAILMDRERLAIQMGEPTKENGLMDFLLDMEYLLGLMETGMKDNTKRD